jgi:quercetin dioxygenase-like cupin family protein
MTVLPRCTAIACLFAAVGCATAFADDEQPAQQQAQQDGQQSSQSRALATETLGALPEATVLNATEIEIGPGYSAPSHRHPGWVFVYVLEGEIRSRINDEPIVLYRAGDIWFEPNGAEHSFFENASATEPARFLVVRVGPPIEPRD